MNRKSLILAILVFLAAFAPLVTSTNTVEAGFGCNTYHNVQRGETLSQIARRYGFTTQQLASLNGITNPNRIYVGQALCIGYRDPGNQPPVGGQAYTIQSGDTLSRIARRFGVDLNVLARVNGISNPNRIYVGQIITIPDVTIQTGS
jgi:LysM repeat protein